MLQLTKRAFVRLSGLAIAHRILPGRLLAQPKPDNPSSAPDLSKLPITAATNGPVTSEKILALQRGLQTCRPR